MIYWHAQRYNVCVLCLIAIENSKDNPTLLRCSDPTGLAAVLFQNSKVRPQEKTCRGDNFNSSCNIAVGAAYMHVSYDSTDVP